ncbi:SGNH/GDSL hydrolase family protein [Solihabitans fulvus]|uniref:SGNH/GDSL hydrolase family protein n=1 Tax=Solihabitans fulvus TaxID=1892852 RepID=A0A5B2WPF1_9PSEU|nr:SGNH/GDSL hydrolase family protein [Solihabitans fulvus]KAA2252700.1 SGNH/GDSL hydrolase family protein [Solihabitans fulvus]
MSLAARTSAIAALAAALLVPLAANADAAPNAGGWVGAWVASAQRPTAPIWYPTWAETGFADQSVRQVIRVGAAGSQLRVRLSNAFGTSPLRLTGGTVGESAGGAAVKPGTVRELTFHGSAAVTIPAGARAASDAVQLPVTAAEQLTVTLYFQGATGPATYHNLALATSYRAAGDRLRDQGAQAFADQSLSWYYLEGVDVTGRDPSVVTFGDSLTDGYGATWGADDRYPDELAGRLAARGNTRPVLNAGLGGNRLLSDSPCMGERGTARFRRDVLDQPRVGTVIVLEGVNDILGSQPGATTCEPPTPAVTAADLIAGHRALICAAHARGVRIVGGTIPPYQGNQSYTDQGDRVRQAVNQWIRTSGEYDAVADFDRALADPADPGRLRADDDFGDHLHPNAAGYLAMAKAVDLDRL